MLCTVWHRCGNSFSVAQFYLSALFVDLLFTLLSSGKILKASTRTNPCKKIQEWDTKTNPDGKVVELHCKISFYMNFFSGLYTPYLPSSRSVTGFFAKRAGHKSNGKKRGYVSQVRTEYLTGSRSISIHAERLQISDARQKQNESIWNRCWVVCTF